MLIKCTGLAISQGGSARSGFEDACASSFGAANSGGTDYAPGAFDDRLHPERQGLRVVHWQGLFQFSEYC